MRFDGDASFIVLGPMERHRWHPTLSFQAAQAAGWYQTHRWRRGASEGQWVVSGWEFPWWMRSFSDKNDGRDIQLFSLRPPAAIWSSNNPSKSLTLLNILYFHHQNPSKIHQNHQNPLWIPYTLNIQTRSTPLKDLSWKNLQFQARKVENFTRRPGNLTRNSWEELEPLRKLWAWKKNNEFPSEVPTLNHFALKLMFKLKDPCSEASSRFEAV